MGRGRKWLIEQGKQGKKSIRRFERKERRPDGSFHTRAKKRRKKNIDTGRRSWIYEKHGTTRASLFSSWVWRIVMYWYMALKLACLAASVGVSAGLIVYYSGSKKEEEEVVVTAEDIYEYNGIDKVAIDAGGKDVILSITAEEKLRKLLNKREKSSLLYKWNNQCVKRWLARQNIRHKCFWLKKCKYVKGITLSFFCHAK